MSTISTTWESSGANRSRDAHTSFSGATLAKNLLPRWRSYADLLRRPHLPADQLEPTSRCRPCKNWRRSKTSRAKKSCSSCGGGTIPIPGAGRARAKRQRSKRSRSTTFASYYAGNYRPNGTILGVAGRFDWQALKDQVGKLFGDWPALAKPTESPSRATGPSATILHHESNQTQIGIAYDSVPYRDPDYFQAWGAVGVLSGGMSSRLFTEVREKRGLCYSVYATHHTLRDRGSVFCYAGTSAERAQETLDVTLGELVRLADGIEPSELDRLKARIKSGADHAAGIELGPQRLDRPRLVSPGPRAHAGRSRRASSTL